MLVQIDVFYTHSLTVDYHASWNFLYQIVHDVNLIDKSIHLRSKSHNLRDAMSVVLILQYGSWKLLVKVKEWWERKKLAFVQFVFVIVHELPTESCSISSTFHMCFWAHCSRNRWWCVWTCPKWQIQWKIVSPLFYSCIPISTNHVPEYMVVPAIMSNPCFWMIASHSFQMVANVTRIPFNPVSTNLKYVEFANNLYRFSSTIMLYLARFSFNRFTYSNMNGACLKGVYVKPYERNQLK